VNVARLEHKSGASTGNADLRDETSMRCRLSDRAANKGLNAMFTFNDTAVWVTGICKGPGGMLKSASQGGYQVGP